MLASPLFRWQFSASLVMNAFKPEPFAITSAESIKIQPFVSVMITEYHPTPAGATKLSVVFAVSFHRYVNAPAPPKA